MRRTLLALIVLASPPATFADDPAPSGDLAKLQGSWTATFGPDQNIPITLEIAKQKVTIKGKTPDGDEFSLNGELKLDEKASPKAVDWVKFTGPDGNEVPDNLGIYKLEGDTFTVCSGGPGNERPTEFKKGDDGHPMLVTFARKKAAGAAPADGAKKGDLAKLQGDWKTMIGPAKDRPVTFTIKDRSVAVTFTTAEGRRLDLKGEIAVNESASPRTIDFVNFKNEGDPMDDSLALYRLDGETLVLCVGPPGGPRPDDFKSGPGDEPPYLWTLTRPK